MDGQPQSEYTEDNEESQDNQESQGSVDVEEETEFTKGDTVFIMD